MLNPLRAKHLLLFIVLAFTATVTLADRLLLRSYTTTDGLANDTVNRIVADSRGFLWFCTGEGLSRFDGFRFKNFTQEHGLPHRNINSLLETAEGDYLLATGGGLVVFDPMGKAFRWDIVGGRLEQNSDDTPMFKTYLTPESARDAKVSKNILSLAEDGNGTVYAGTNHGLFKFIKSDTGWIFEKVEFDLWKDGGFIFNALYTDLRKNLWLVTNNAVFLMDRNGKISEINESGGNSIFEDRNGNIWVDSGGDNIGIRFYSYAEDSDPPTLSRTYTTKDGLSSNGFTNAIAESVDGKIFVSCNGKLHEFLPEAKAREATFRRIDNELYSAAKDKSGNLWFTTLSKGVVRQLPNSFYTLGEGDGLKMDWITSIFGNSNAEVFLTDGANKLARVKDGNIDTVQPSGLAGRHWIAIALDFQSSDGEFWIPSGKGLVRYPMVKNFNDLAHTKPKKIYTTVDGLFGDEISAVFEDSRGDVWISAVAKDNSLLRWERSTNQIHRYTNEQGLPQESVATTFGEDSAGNIWIGFYFGQLYRFKDGKFRDLADEGLIPRNLVRKFLTDNAGRLWIATSSRGLFRVDVPDADAPTFTNLSVQHGLSSNQTWCLTMDKKGRIYAATGRGISRIEPETGRIKVFTQNDGLPGSNIERCYADVSGNLWFSWANSLIKYTPEGDKFSASPPTFIDAIAINGKRRAISELGEKEIKDIDLEPHERQIEVGFFAISFEAGETLRYQYRINDQDWSEPSERRTVDLNLSPGTYDFAVRAISADGILSENSAKIAITIARPVWQRWWFIAMAIILVGGVAFALFRYRLARVREVQMALESLSRSRAERLAELHRVRTRIATDLHDDIGSSLTQIAVLSEVARNHAAVLESDGISTKLESIKRVSRELVESMSDVVWAINPNKDTLSDLVQRMRRFGSDYCSARNIRFSLGAPSSEEKIPLGANIRREIFAIFKEAVNNAVKYAECENVKADLWFENDKLLLKIFDDGQGFDTKTTLSPEFSPDLGGNGLVNMQRRASDLGGSCKIDSTIGSGTSIFISVPLSRSDIEILAPTQLGGESDHRTSV